MTTIAQLGIRVDSGDAVQAATDLEKMTKAGERAEQSAVGLMNEMQALERSLSAGAKSTQELAKQRESLARLTKTGAYGEAEFLKISAQLDKQQQALVKSTMDEQKALVSLLGSVDPAQAALAKLDKQVEDLGKHLDAGRISQAQYNEALKKIDGKYAEIEKTSSAFSSLGLHTKGARENVLQLGNALAEGNLRVAAHNILEIGSSAGTSALRLAGIVAPAAAAVGAIIGVGYAYYSGAQEAKEFQKALIFTGNAAGTTADRLAGMASQISATVGTTGASAEVLTQLASSGKVASDSFVEITQAALEWRDATGRAVEETVAEFVKIGKDPVAAAKDLNEQYNFLTAATYSQIVALKEQGDTIGAAKLLTDTYVDTIKNRSKEVTENLSIWERGWKALRGEVAATVDSVSNIGRGQDIASRIIETQQRVAAAKSAVNGDPYDTAAQRKLTDANLELKALIQQRDTQQAIAKAQELDAQRQQAAIVAIGKIDALEKSARTNAEKRADALKEYNKSLDAIRKVNQNDERLKPENIARVQDDIAKQFKDPAGRSTAVDLTGFNDQKNALAAIVAEYRNHQKELDAAQKAGLISQESYASQRAAIIEQQKAEVTNAYEGEIRALEEARGRSSTSAQQRIQLDQKIADARAAMVKAQKDADTELAVLATNEQGRLAKQARAVQTYTDALEQQVKALRLQGQRSADSLGLGDRQRSLQDQQNGITDRINQQRLDLANQYGDGSRGMSLDEYNQKLAALSKTEKDLQETTIANYDQMTVAQGDWRKGASSAFQNYLEQARDVAGQTRSLFTNAFSSMEDAVVNFAITGKFSFADFTKSILADMARIAARQAASGLLGGLVNLGGAAASAYFGGGSGNGMAAGSPGAVSSNLGASQAGYSSAYFPQALGGAWSNGVQMFADGGAFTNSIVSTPTAFGMAGGRLGVMGEAGDEAVMPLTRTAGGQLGVRAIGGGGASISLSAPVSLVMEDRSGEGMQLDPTLLQQNMQKQVQIAAEKAVADSWRPGGVSYRNTTGRR